MMSRPCKQNQKNKEGKKMSEENKVVYCTGCGAENPEGFKFCSNCGTKLEVAQPEDPMQPVYEKIEAEIIESNESEVIEENAGEAFTNEDVVVESTPFEEELNINYEPENTASEPVYQTQATPQPQYYSAEQSVDVKTGNGNIGLSIASMVCGILALLCCCSGFFGIVLSIGAVVLGVISIKNNYDGKGMAIAGLITGGIGLLFALLMIIVAGFSDAFTEALDEIANY